MDAGRRRQRKQKKLGARRNWTRLNLACIGYLGEQIYLYKARWALDAGSPPSSASTRSLDPRVRVLNHKPGKFLVRAGEQTGRGEQVRSRADDLQCAGPPLAALLATEMTTINSPPPKIFYRIIEVHLEDEDSGGRACERAFLLSTCLVARSWRHPSQSFLWHKISLGGTQSARLMASNPVGVYPCVSLSLHSASGNLAAGKALAACGALRFLRISCPVALDFLTCSGLSCAYTSSGTLAELTLFLQLSSTSTCRSEPPLSTPTFPSPFPTPSRAYLCATSRPSPHCRHLPGQLRHDSRPTSLATRGRTFDRRNLDRPPPHL